MGKGREKKIVLNRFPFHVVDLMPGSLASFSSVIPPFIWFSVQLTFGILSPYLFKSFFLPFNFFALLNRFFFLPFFSPSHFQKKDMRMDGEKKDKKIFT